MEDKVLVSQNRTTQSSQPNLTTAYVRHDPRPHYRELRNRYLEGWRAKQRLERTQSEKGVFHALMDLKVAIKQLENFQELDVQPALYELHQLELREVSRFDLEQVETLLCQLGDLVDEAEYAVSVYNLQSVLLQASYDSRIAKAIGQRGLEGLCLSEEPLSVLVKLANELGEKPVFTKAKMGLMLLRISNIMEVQELVGQYGLNGLTTAPRDVLGLIINVVTDVLQDEA